jgi:hypothetical protein
MRPFLLLLSLPLGSLAHVCKNVTIALALTSQNTVFNLEPPSTEVQVTDFFLQASVQGHNYIADIRNGVSIPLNRYLKCIQ